MKIRGIMMSLLVVLILLGSGCGSRKETTAGKYAIFYLNRNENHISSVAYETDTPKSHKQTLTKELLEQLSTQIEKIEYKPVIRGFMECQELFQHPLLYGTFLLWMLSEIYEMLPEAGDLEKPKMAFFFDEAHLLFDDAPKALVEKVEQVVRLIRSKGVSVWFITQNPTDIPDSVLGQIGNRVQHALRAYTPNDQKALRSAANSFRVNPAFDTEEVLTALGTGEALVSVLDEKGVPTIVERANILPPRSSMSAVDAVTLQAQILASPLEDKYDDVEDRESAYEVLKAKQEAEARAEQEAKELAEREAALEAAEKKRAAERKSTSSRSSSTRKKQSALEKTISSAANTIGREVGKKIGRGLFATFCRR